MNQFFIKILAFMSPFLVVLGGMMLLDPFKIWFKYDNYYENYDVTLNRERICVELYNTNYNKYHFDSYILGNSRSHAFKTQDWVKYLDSNSSPFHFDASNEGIYGILNKARYLDKLNVKIKNVLIVVDENSMMINHINQAHIFISHPDLSHQSPVKYYLSFIIASMNPKFIYSYVDYKINGQIKDYMSWFISEYIPKGNEFGDVDYWSYDEMIKNDSLKYYSQLINKGVLYERNTSVKTIQKEMSSLEKSQLQNIAEILKKHKTKYQIVISPLFNQIPISNTRLEFLHQVFGKANVHDFSGKNKFTEHYWNFYEDSHYRPHVAKEIMGIIYRDNVH